MTYLKEIVLKPCPVCGIELLGSLADAVADPKREESCPKTGTVSDPLPVVSAVREEVLS